MADHESTMKWKVDVGQLTKAMQEAKRAINLANVEFKTATAGIDRWSKSTTGLEAKLKQLNATLPQQKKILADLEKQYKLVSENLGENSREAQDLKVKIEEQRATIVKAETNISKYSESLDEMQKEQAQSQTAYAKLSKTIDDQQEQVDKLKAAYKNAVIQFGENSTEAKTLATQIDKLSSELVENKEKLRETDVAADKLDKSLDNVGGSAKDAANGGFTVLKGAMANLVAQGIGKAIDGLRELGKKIVDIGKQSITEYANYEQLIGGVETLFKESAKTVEKYANGAYKSAGMSANAYMETVTGFSASLLQGLNNDTAKAAKIADMAILDMSDNANKMGSDISSLQTAYQGFAKGNFTMLDNLKLGYGGTKEEMLRLVKDAGVVNDAVDSIDDVSFDKIIEAIHIVQDEMGITGTTSKEAANTIEGSKNSMLAAWSNLLKEFAKSDGDIESAFDAFLESAIAYGKNLIPRIGELADNAMDFFRQRLEQKSPELLKYIDTIVEIVSTVANAIKSLFGFLIENGDAVIAVIAGLASATAVYLGYTTALKVMTEGWMALSVVQKIVAAKQAVLNAVMALNPMGLVIAGIVALVAAFVVLWKKSDAFRQFWIDLWEKIKDITSKVVESIANWFSGLWDGIKAVWGVAVDWFKALWDGIKEVFAPVIDFFATLFGNAWTAIQNIWLVAKVFFSTVWDGIKAVFSPVADWFKSIFQKAWDIVKGIWNAAKGFFQGIWGGIKDVFGNVAGWFKEKFQAAWNAVKSVFSAVGEFFGGVWETIKEKFTNIGQKVGDAVGGAFKKAVNAVLATAENVLNAPIRAINALIGKLQGIPGLGGLGTLSTFSLPRLARGGILKKGQIGLLEGSGAEAVVPLENNRQWISKLAAELLNQLDIQGIKGNVIAGTGEIIGRRTVSQNITFNQTINSPRPVSRLEVYRDTNSLLFSAGVKLKNV